MANRTINNLTAVTSLTSTDNFAVDQTDSTKRVTLEQLETKLGENFMEKAELIYSGAATDIVALTKTPIQNDLFIVKTNNSVITTPNTVLQGYQTSLILCGQDNTENLTIWNTNSSTYVPIVNCSLTANASQAMLYGSPSGYVKIYAVYKIHLGD